MRHLLLFVLLAGLAYLNLRGLFRYPVRTAGWPLPFYCRIVEARTEHPDGTTSFHLFTSMTIQIGPWVIKFDKEGWKFGLFAVDLLITSAAIAVVILL